VSITLDCFLLLNEIHEVRTIAFFESRAIVLYAREQESALDGVFKNLLKKNLDKIAQKV